MDLTVRLNPRLAVGWINFMRLVAPLIGPSLALRLATAGARRLFLIKVGDRRWQWLKL